MCACTHMCTNKRQNWKVPNKIGAFICGLRGGKPGGTGLTEVESMTQRDKGVRVFKEESCFDQNVIGGDVGA